MGNTPAVRKRRDHERQQARAEAVAADRVRTRAGTSALVRRLHCEAGGPAALDRVTNGPALPEWAYRFAWREALEAWRDARSALSGRRNP